MARARRTENSANEGDVRGAAAAAPRSTPLKLVQAAVAGDDLQSIARIAAAALSCTVAIALPTFGLSAQWPAAAALPEALSAVQHYAVQLVNGGGRPAPQGLGGVVPVRLGHEIVGVVAALAQPGTGVDTGEWLDAAAAAAAITALMRDGAGGDPQHARRSFLQMLERHPETQPDALVGQARRLGYDFSNGALAIGAALEGSGVGSIDLGALGDEVLLADVGDQRLLGLVPLSAETAEARPQELLDQLREAGATAIAAAPRHGPGAVHDALREAAVLLELLVDAEAMLSAHEETYRLLVRLLIHNPDELLSLRASTVAPLEAYDATHDTDLLATLETFLAHHGSTTDTAERMQLHRHTVGYRLARVQEVSGLSPYESAGRERLGLGLKANRILLADQRRAGRLQRGGGPAGPAAPATA